MKLVRCRGCGIMHRADATCHWCGEIKSRFPLPANVVRSAAALMLVAGAAAGMWRFGPAVQQVTAAIGREISTPATAPTVSVAVSTSARSEQPEAAVPASELVVSDSALLLGGEPSEPLAVGDSVQWTPAVARTWVNVRSDASRGGEVVGVIKPAARAMLGTDRAGWRRVRSTEVSGWVDPRHFQPDSLHTRGE